MIIHKYPISWYIEQMEKPYSLPGFSDAEWFCLIEERVGHRTGYGQLLTGRANDMLRDALRLKGRVFRAMPSCLLSFPQGERVREYARYSLRGIEFYERDMITDELAKRAGLAPLIAKLRTMKVGLVGNPALSELEVIPIAEFFPTDPNDFHLNRKGMKEVIVEIQKRPCDIYLFSSGISAACMIGRLHGKVDATLFDCGSIWDAYVGIGGQREWRAALYENPELLKSWKKANEPV